MDILIQQLINGLVLGCMYGLLALSYTLVFGVLRIINFAIGETLMAGAFFSIAVAHLLQRWGVFEESPICFLTLTLCAALLGGLLFALLTELIAFRLLRKKKDTSMFLCLISSLGVAIFAQNFVLKFIDSGNVHFPEAIAFKKIAILGASVTTVQIMIIAMSIGLMACVSLLVYKTRLGQQIRAVRDNPGLAGEYGINTNRVVIITFAISGVLAGFAGFSMGCYYGIARYNMGFFPGIKAFSAAILGGIGDVPGGMLGGVLIGLVESLSAGYISAEYKDVIVFSILVLTLLFRPKGILGRGIE